MSSKRKGTMKYSEKLQYAAELIGLLSPKEKAPMRIVEAALHILEYGGITPKQFLEYIEAVGR